MEPGGVIRSNRTSQPHQSWYENEVGKSVPLGKGAQNLGWISTLKRLK